MTSNVTPHTAIVHTTEMNINYIIEKQSNNPKTLVAEYASSFKPLVESIQIILNKMKPFVAHGLQDGLSIECVGYINANQYEWDSFFIDNEFATIDFFNIKDATFGFKDLVDDIESKPEFIELIQQLIDINASINFSALNEKSNFSVDAESYFIEIIQNKNGYDYQACIDLFVTPE